MIKLLILGALLHAVVPTPDPVKVRRAEADLKQLLLGKAIVREAEKHLGVPYVWGGKEENKDGGLDCSGFTSVVLQSFGIKVSATATEQYMGGLGIERPALGPGDLVFFVSEGPTPLHVGIYAGEDEFIHAPGTGKTISRTSLSKGYFSTRYVGARRYAAPYKPVMTATPTREKKP